MNLTFEAKRAPIPPRVLTTNLDKYLMNIVKILITNGKSSQSHKLSDRSYRIELCPVLGASIPYQRCLAEDVLVKKCLNTMFRFEV